MNTENVVKHLRALWRTDRIIADIRLRHLLVGLGLPLIAIIVKNMRKTAVEPAADASSEARS